MYFTRICLFLFITTVAMAAVEDNYRFTYYFLHGKELIGQGATAEGMVELEKALSYNPSSAGANFYMGMAYYGKGDYLKSIGYFEKSVRANANVAQVYKFWASALKQLGLLDQAVEKMEMGHRLDPENLAFYPALADLCMRIGKYDRAVSALEAALKRKYNFMPAYSMLIKVHLLRKNSAEALKFAKQAMLIDSNDIGYYISAGEILREMGDYDEAVSVLERAVKMNPNNRRPLLYLARLQKIKGNNQLSEQYFKAFSEASSKEK